jgi:hypothetical protein
MAAVTDDRQEPRACRTAAELGKTVPGPSESILHGILAQLGVPREIASEVVGAVEVGKDRRLECGMVRARQKGRPTRGEGRGSGSALEAHVMREFASIGYAVTMIFPTMCG